MDSYRERLGPSVRLYLICALVIPATLIIFAPISPWVGVIVAIVLYSGVALGLFLGSPVLSVGDGRLRAGSASISVAQLGKTAAYRRAAATDARGTGLDARAWLCIRGWIDPVLRIDLTDPDDPAPYWLVSSRQPERLAEEIAVEKARVTAGNSALG